MCVIKMWLLCNAIQLFASSFVLISFDKMDAPLLPLILAAQKRCTKSLKEAAFLVRIFHVFLWRCSKLELHFTRKAD